MKLIDWLVALTVAVCLSPVVVWALDGAASLVVRQVMGR